MIMHIARKVHLSNIFFTTAPLLSSFRIKYYCIHYIPKILLLLSIPSSIGIIGSCCAMSVQPQNQRNYKVIDSHLHVWGDENEVDVYPYQQEPPTNIKNIASVDTLIQLMNDNNIDGSLIVQPINYKNDHSYVMNAIKKYPNQLKGMMLYDPLYNTNVNDAIERLNDLVLQGFVGVRFNPYLFQQINENQWELMSKPNSISLRIYQRCGELNIPVGIMCFKGLKYHYNDIIQLSEISPKTIMIIDHFGFTSLSQSNDNEDDDKQFQQLLSLAKYPNVIIKISALFRLHDTDTTNYNNVYKHRFMPLLESFGSERLMYGSDFPFVMVDTEQKYQIHHIIESWIANDVDKANIMGGTAERIFGPWGIPVVPSSQMASTTSNII